MQLARGPVGPRMNTPTPRKHIQENHPTAACDELPVPWLPADRGVAARALGWEGPTAAGTSTSLSALLRADAELPLPPC